MAKAIVTVMHGANRQLENEFELKLNITYFGLMLIVLEKFKVLTKFLVDQLAHHHLPFKSRLKFVRQLMFMQQQKI